MKVERFEDIISWQKADELGKISQDEFDNAYILCEDISKLLSGFIKTL